MSGRRIGALLGLGVAACGGQLPDASWRVTDAGLTACGDDTWSSYGQPFFLDNCVSCHANYGTYRNVVSDVDEVGAQIASASMPKDHELSAEERQRILTWLSCITP